MLWLTWAVAATVVAAAGVAGLAVRVFIWAAGL